jgi:hypothetical protein
MAKISTSYESLDGKKFLTELEADAHDMAVSQAASVAAFVIEARLGKAEATRAAKYVSAYTVFMASYEEAKAAA